MEPAKSNKKASDSSQRPARRSDGEETRQRIIECAGRIFARDGYYKATSKEICQRAGVNQAAVNYHFGSRDGVYEAVLVEAHNQLVRLEALQAISEGHEARDAIELFLSMLVQAAQRHDDWYVKVWVREMLSPSPVLKQVIVKEAMPKFELVRRSFAEYLGCGSDTSKLYAAMMTVLAPFVFAVIGNMSPALEYVPDKPALSALLEELHRNALQELDALHARLHPAANA